MHKDKCTIHLKVTAFRVLTPCLVDVCECFLQTQCLNIQGYSTFSKTFICFYQSTRGVTFQKALYFIVTAMETTFPENTTCLLEIPSTSRENWDFTRSISVAWLHFLSGHYCEVLCTFSSNFEGPASSNGLGTGYAECVPQLLQKENWGSTWKTGHCYLSQVLWFHSTIVI